DGCNGGAGYREFGAAGGGDRIHFAGSVVGGEVEPLVRDDGTAYAAAELLLLMDGLGVDAGGLLNRIEGVEGGIAQVVEQIAMHGVGARAGDGVDDATCGLAELGAV